MFDQISIPVHTIGGWFDIFTQGTQNGYIGMSKHGQDREARRQCHMVIGPWGHGVRRSSATRFRPAAKLERECSNCAGIDYWLKGAHNGLD